MALSFGGATKYEILEVTSTQGLLSRSA